MEEEIKLNEELLKEYENLENEEQGIQTTFNEDSIEDLNDSSIDAQIENTNEEEIEGIGATGFSMRTTKPSGNLNYMTTSTGGWSTCIKGSPNDPKATVLANCVGYASARFNEIINLCRGTSGCTYKTLNCNAENFPERATAAGLKIGSTPRVGAIGCAMKGSTLSGSDGAGHVWIVEKVNSSSSTYTSESGYGSSTLFWNQTRTNSNGRWGLGSGYTFRCFIYLPDDVQKWVDGSSSEITPNVDKNIYKNQIEVKISDLRVRTGAGTDKSILGFASKGYYNFYETADASGYKWYRIADGQWIASSDDWTTIYPAQTPTYKYKVGDKVVINGALYVSSNAANPSGSVSNKVTNITRVAVGAAHPYNTTGDLGWMNESDIKPYEEPTPTPPSPTPTTEKKGLDLSAWQEGINFDAIKNSEYNQFVILRGGFTGYGTGVSYNKDKCFEGFYADAKARGIPVGCYWFSCANTYDKGVAEANFMYENCLKGKQFEYPIYIDVEDEHWQSGNKDGVTAAIKGFCETLEAKKFYVGIYASDISGFKEKMNIDQLTNYDKWVARYGSKPQYVTSYGMWQTASDGRISGYGENLDTDIAYKDYPTIIKEAKLNGYGDEPQPTPPTPEPPTPTPPTYKYNIGDKVVINGQLYGNADGGNPGRVVSNKVTNITRRADGHPYPYNTTGDLGWMVESSISPYTAPAGFAVGDKVVPTKLVSYTGQKLVQYDDYYYITDLKGNRAVLSAKRNGKYVVWAAMNTANIKKA